jgi:hypothetical protein
VLFFNLFLERLVTCLSYALRQWHERKLSRRLAATDRPVTLLVNNVDLAESARPVPRPSLNSLVIFSSFEGNSDPWRPSVYKVFLCLLAVCSLTVSLAAAFYHRTEHWSYLDALYFCFIRFISSPCSS